MGTRLTISAIVHVLKLPEYGKFCRPPRRCRVHHTERGGTCMRAKLSAMRTTASSWRTVMGTAAVPLAASRAAARPCARTASASDF